MSIDGTLELRQGRSCVKNHWSYDRVIQLMQKGAGWVGSDYVNLKKTLTEFVTKGWLGNLNSREYREYVEMDDRFLKGKEMREIKGKYSPW